MNLSVSNIALPQGDGGALLAAVAGLGFGGLEVAASKVWDHGGDHATAAEVDTYRRHVEASGLRVVGLHSLFFHRPDLGLFRDAATRAATLDFLAHLSGLCRDLGGRTLIYGSAPARRRGALSKADAVAETVDFFGALAQRIAGHGTCYCFEPLGPDEADFVNSAYDALDIVRQVDHTSLRMQLDAKALAANGEMTPQVFADSRALLAHYHANDPGLTILGSTGQVDHALLGRALADIGYDGWVSLEQRMIDPANPLDAIAASAAAMQECYR